MVRALLVAVAILAVSVAPAVAQFDDVTETALGSPSILGPTGALVTPTTTVNDELYSIGYHWVNDTLDAAVKLNASPIEKLEVGIMHFQTAGLFGTDETIFQAKYRLVDEDDDNPALTIGVWDFTDEVDITWYGVVSKTIDGEVPITINVGGASGDVVLDGIFGSVILGIHEDVDVIAEYDTSEVNFGLRISPYDGLVIDVCSVDNRVDRELGLGASYTTDF